MRRSRGPVKGDQGPPLQSIPILDGGDESYQGSFSGQRGTRTFYICNVKIEVAKIFCPSCLMIGQLMLFLEEFQ
jgi:hypothetical protein